MARASFGDPTASPYVLPYPPGKSYRIIQGYCEPEGSHVDQLAYDFGMPIGDDVTAARAGIVIELRDGTPDISDWEYNNQHNYIFIQHEDGTVAFYAHLKKDSIVVQVGQSVDIGQRIAASGNSGMTGGKPHLHFGVYGSYPTVEGFDVPVNFRNADGPLDTRGGLCKWKYYQALPLENLAFQAMPTNDEMVQGWAVLAEKDDYSDVDMTDLPVEYIGIAQMRQMLEGSGWTPDQIIELREFDRETLQDNLDWLAENADQDDVVFLYVAAHGKYLSDVLVWDEFFADEWEQISSHRRLLIIDSCQAAHYTGIVSGDPSPYLSIAAVAGDEYGWSGLEEEGLPIIGGVFTHYFAAAFDDPDTDTDGDGFVSVQEAALLAEGQQRAYMHDVVFAVPEFLESYHDIGAFPDRDPNFPHVVVDDTIGEPIYLMLDAYP
jgi:murein DD-endopeptidase MepM/ murein hydrolase activator NlpD